jgi:addiction module RelB/DinJ family antitoxin
MPKSAIIRVRIDSEHQQKAEAILKDLGVTPGQAIGMMYAQIVQHRGLPFIVALADPSRKRPSSGRLIAETWSGLDSQDYSALLKK